MKSKRLLLTLLLALIVPWAAMAQTLAEYTVTTGSETYTTIVGVEGTTHRVGAYTRIDKSKTMTGDLS